MKYLCNFIDFPHKVIPLKSEIVGTWQEENAHKWIDMAVASRGKYTKDENGQWRYGKATGCAITMDTIHSLRHYTEGFLGQWERKSQEERRNSIKSGSVYVVKDNWIIITQYVPKYARFMGGYFIKIPNVHKHTIDSLRVMQRLSE